MAEFIEIEALDRAVTLGKESLVQGGVRHHHASGATRKATNNTSFRWIDYPPVVRVEESSSVIEMNSIVEGLEHIWVVMAQRDSHRVYRQRVKVEGCIFTIRRVKPGVIGAPLK